MSGAKSGSAALRSGFGSARDLLPRWAWILVFLGLALLFPYVVPEILSGGSGDDLLDASVNTLGYVIMALGLNIVVGFAGLLDLGYVAFYAFGAFVVGWMASGQFEGVNLDFLTDVPSTIPGIHVNFVVIVIVAAAFTGIWGVILGAPTLRLRGDYLAIVTLAFGEIVPRVFENWEGVSNGRQGITPIDRVYFPGVGELNYPIELEGIYYVGLAMVLITLFVNIRLRDSRLGRAWIAVREDEVAAAAMGVNLVRTKLWAYAVGAAFGGFAGAFLGAYRNTVNVDQFEFGFSVFILCMIIVGGMGNVAGVILGAIALSMLDRFVLPQLNDIPDKIGLEFDLTAVNFGIFGFFLLVMMVLRPEGFIPSTRRRLELHSGDEIEDAAADRSAEAAPGEALYEARH
jgi:branched-chain amino acid transport system permease protein